MSNRLPVLSDPRFREAFDRMSKEDRARFLKEEEEWWCAVDLHVYRETFGDPHPNEEYEFAPLEKRKAHLR